MLKRLLFVLAVHGLAAPLAAQEAADPYCPAYDRELPSGPDWLCYGRVSDDYVFAFAYPKAVERVPALDAEVRREAVLAEAWIADQARQAQAEGRETPRMTYEALWQVDAILPEIAAASASISHYTGGAHGGLEYRTILLDRRSGSRIEIADIFSPGFFGTRLLGHRLWGERAVQRAFCRALAAAVRSRRDDAAADLHCPPIEEQPVTLLCGPGGRIEALRALLNPYVAGSWAEGPYEVDVPIDAAMMSVIKPRLRPAFGLALEERPRVPARPCR